MFVLMKKLTEAEEQIMRILWKHKKAFVKEIREEYSDPKPAYNTLSTTIRILEKKGIVSHNTFGKSHQYYPLLTEKEYNKNTINNLITNYFNGSIANLVSFFNKEEKLSEKEIDELKKFINEQE